MGKMRFFPRQATQKSIIYSEHEKNLEMARVHFRKGHFPFSMEISGKSQKNSFPKMDFELVFFPETHGKRDVICFLGCAFSQEFIKKNFSRNYFEFFYFPIWNFLKNIFRK